MHNISARENIELCLDELNKISSLIDGLGKTSNPVPFLTKYAIIKACGTIEYCFKTIISDVYDGTNVQIRNYIDKSFRHSSINPSYDKICGSLNKFDASWNRTFKDQVKLITDKEKVLQSLDSLNEARNSFAHGGHPTTSFDNVKVYFNDAVVLIKILDSIIHTSTIAVAV